MKIVDEYTPKLNIPQGVLLTSLFQRDCTLYGVYGRKKRLYIFCNSEDRVLTTTRSFHKMAYVPQTHSYLMSCRSGNSASATLYLLDAKFNETDRLQIRSNKVENIYFDAALQMIFVVTPLNIQRYNCNGDYLGVFMNTHKKRCYQSLCTFGKFIFLAYKMDGCTYIASYNFEGTYFERASLGCEYAVQNMQVVFQDDCPILRIYAIKNSCYPFFIELGLNASPSLSQPCKEHETIQVECISEDCTLQTTAYIREDNSHELTYSEQIGASPCQQYD